MKRGDKLITYPAVERRQRRKRDGRFKPSAVGESKRGDECCRRERERRRRGKDGCCRWRRKVSVGRRRKDTERKNLIFVLFLGFVAPLQKVVWKPKSVSRNVSTVSIRVGASQRDIEDRIHRVGTRQLTWHVWYVSCLCQMRVGVGYASDTGTMDL